MIVRIGDSLLDVEQVLYAYWPYPNRFYVQFKNGEGITFAATKQQAESVFRQIKNRQNKNPNPR